MIMRSHFKANYIGSSGGMEVAGALQLFHRSEELYDVRYLDYLGDGDSKAFQSVNDSKPYGADIEIDKIECSNHVMKRMGSRLRKLKAEKKKLSDGTQFRGKNKLTYHAIQMLQIYYGLAIKRNPQSVSSMEKAVWAGYYHVCSSNLQPRHQLCPTSDDTWCKYQQAKKMNKPYDHDKHFHIPEKVMKEIRPIFVDLSNKSLLARCLPGKTQNISESFNNVIWTVIPKRTFVGLRTLCFGVNEAVCKFNAGNITKIMDMEKWN